ncbi:glutathione S-transferase [Salinispirillum sp. LH 10-3-1]|uniref:Glutathione S-transferase n=1 Tax=Salinispirillum sp. LH 10-3-1 TaxID=2952525 RepID=A0AB38YBL2_9GAMM
MELFGSYTSPFVRHCRIALLETGLACTFVETDYAESARRSPTKKVPYLHDGDVMLFDSCSILKYLREKAGGSFLADVKQYDRFSMINTALDATVNLFLLEKEGVTPANNDYLKRQQARVESSVAEMNRFVLAQQAPYNDAELRLACYIDWVIFRNRLDLSPYPELTAFVTQAHAYEPFHVTRPPQ